MNFCELDKRIKLQEKGETRDEMGGVDDAWSTIATVWAKRQVLSGRQLEAAKSIAATVDTKFSIRQSTDVSAVNTTWQIEHNNKEYEINHVDDTDSEWLHIYTTRRSDT